MAIQWHLFVTPGLGDNSYLLFSEDEAVIVDPQRDAWRFLEFAESNKLRIRYVLETHVHNDYVSGSLEVRSATGAKVAAPAKGNYKFDHLRMSEGLEVRIGAARIVCWETPGHTFEHVSWIVYEEGQQDPVALFSGGSLLVGGAGRTDLIGKDSTGELTRKQYQSIQRIKTLPPTLAVLPTHGAGSFCAAGGERKERVTTIAGERKQNHLMNLVSEELFAQEHLANLPAYPVYYAHMAPINRNEPTILKSLPQIQSIPVSGIGKSSSWIVDMRNRKNFAAAHIPGSINIELDESFATYAGWIVPFGAPIILIAEAQKQSEQIQEAVTQLIRIGYENIKGYLENGLENWIASTGAVRSYATGTIEAYAPITMQVDCV